MNISFRARASVRKIFAWTASGHKIISKLFPTFFMLLLKPSFGQFIVSLILRMELHVARHQTSEKDVLKLTKLVYNND